MKTVQFKIPEKYNWIEFNENKIHKIFIEALDEEMELKEDNTTKIEVDNDKEHSILDNKLRNVLWIL